MKIYYRIVPNKHSCLNKHAPALCVVILPSKYVKNLQKWPKNISNVPLYPLNSPGYLSTCRERLFGSIRYAASSGRMSSSEKLGTRLHLVVCECGTNGHLVMKELAPCGSKQVFAGFQWACVLRQWRPPREEVTLQGSNTKMRKHHSMTSFPGISSQFVSHFTQMALYISRAFWSSSHFSCLCASCGETS